MNLGGELRTGAEALGLSLQQTQYDQLLEYLYLLEKWSRVYNLTALKGLSKMMNYHLLDSLSLAPRLGNCRKAIDVGSGAGRPGIPRAIAMPIFTVSALGRGPFLVRSDSEAPGTSSMTRNRTEPVEESASSKP